MNPKQRQNCVLMLSPDSQPPQVFEKSGSPRKEGSGRQKSLKPAREKIYSRVYTNSGFPFPFFFWNPGHGASPRPPFSSLRLTELEGSVGEVGHKIEPTPPGAHRTVGADLVAGHFPKPSRVRGHAHPGIKRMPCHELAKARAKQGNRPFVFELDDVPSDLFKVS